jgi:hypothetical protein
VIPGARSAAPRPSADEPALIRKERRVAIPPPPGPREAPAPPKAQAASSEREPAPAARPEETAAAPALERLRPGRKEKPAAEARPADLPKKADKGIKVKSGTEGWE